MIQIVLLAAGKGTRMRSDVPKVLTPVNGIPIIVRLLKNIEPISAKPVLVVGHKAEEVIQATENKYIYALQKEQLGTGHAVMAARDVLGGNEDIKRVLVLNGDHPLIRASTLQKLIEIHSKSGATITMGTTVVEEFAGLQKAFEHFGRVVRDEHGNVDHIVEFKDATVEEKEIKEVNANYYCFDAKWLWDNIQKLETKNASKEFYITDMVGLAKHEGRRVDAFVFDNIECLGINTPEELRVVEEVLGGVDNA